MDAINKTPEEYKKLILSSLKTKFNLFMIGVFVIATVLQIILINSTHVGNKFSEITSKPPTPPARLNIDTVISGTQKNLASQLNPTNTTDTSALNNSGLSLDVGDTSSIMSDRVTFTGKTYTVQEGDSLASIAEKIYGDSNAWITLAQANNLESPDQITVGMVLKIPR